MVLLNCNENNLDTLIKWKLFTCKKFSNVEILRSKILWNFMRVLCIGGRAGFGFRRQLSSSLFDIFESRNSNLSKTVNSEPKKNLEKPSRIWINWTAGLRSCRKSFDFTFRSFTKFYFKYECRTLGFLPLWPWN